MEKRNMEKRNKILIVENNDTLRELLKITLKSRGYVVETACNGLTGLQKLEKEPYDLLITDNQMPNMNGLDLIEEICRREINIRILMISGRFTRDIVERAKERGVLECLEKPFSFRRIIGTVGKALKIDTISKWNHELDQFPKLLEAGAR